MSPLAIASLIIRLQRLDGPLRVYPAAEVLAGMTDVPAIRPWLAGVAETGSVVVISGPDTPASRNFLP